MAWKSMDDLLSEDASAERTVKLLKSVICNNNQNNFTVFS